MNIDDASMNQTDDGLRAVLSLPAHPYTHIVWNVNEPTTPSWSRINRVLLGLILLYPVPFMFQGLDWSDLGFWVSSYQQVFRDPASIASSFTCWLTVVIGGAWMWITSPLGLLGAKLGYVVVSGLTMFITYVTLRRAFRGSETAMLGALFVAATYVYYDDYGAMNWISYNDLSALFFAWAAYHLMRGITEDRPLHLAAAGAVLALNLFVRLPNLVGAGLGLAILYNEILTKRSLRRLGSEVGAFAGGYVGGVACAFLLMAVLGHVGYIRVGGAKSVRARCA